MFEQYNLTNDFNGTESRLRSFQPDLPRLDRDHLMYLAGQQSARSLNGVRRLWPALTVTSWAACAAIIAVLAARPPQVVVETRVVERVLVVPAEPATIKAPGTEPSSAVAEKRDPTALFSNGQRTGVDFDFLNDPHRPLTALASRPALYQRTAEPTAVASVDSSASAPPPVGAKTYSELRRELLGDHRAGIATTGPLWWF